MTLVYTLLARLDRRLAGLRRRAERLLLEREHPGLVLAESVLLEPGVLWRLDVSSHVKVGDRTRLRANVELKADAGAVLAIGRDVHIGPGCTLSALQQLVIGDDCLIAERVSIRDHDHSIADPTRPYHTQGYTIRGVRIGSNVWIGGGATITKGIELGANCVVGANSVVTHSFPANSVIAGVPARLIRVLCPDEQPQAA